MKPGFKLPLLTLTALLACACTPVIKLWPIEKSSASPQPSPSAGLSNPATLNCIQNNGTSLIRPSTQGETGYCVFRDRSYCEEWAFYRNQCKPGDNMTSPF